MLCKCNHIVATGLLLLLAGILACGQAYAESVLMSQLEQENKLSENLRLGSQQYQQGDYAQAKVFYELALTQALAQGKPVHSIYYNLGSVCYQLKLYDQSKDYFTKLINHNKLKAVAYYNLALVENKQSNKKSTIKYLNKSKEATADSQLSSLIDQQLLKLNEKTSGKTKEKTAKDWHAYFYLSHGYDSNIRFAPLEIASNESGSFLQAYGLVDKKIAGKGHGKKEPALLVTASVFSSNYYSTDFNDYNIYDIGLRYLLPVNEWRNTIELNIKKSTYGHTDYQRIYGATFKTRRFFFDGNVLRLRYRYEQIDSQEPVYDYLQGYRQRLRLGYQFNWPNDAMDLWYELELNDRENTVNRNYSPTRNTYRLRYEKKINTTNKVYAELEYRHSDYDPTATQDRLDKRSGYLLAYVNDITRDWQFMARWGYRSNHSTESIFSYDRHVAMLTLRKVF